MKKIITFLIVVILFSSCADSKVFEIDGQKIEVEPYGWANAEANKDPRVIYDVSVGNVVWSVIGFETIILPIWLTGYKLYEPVKLRTVESNEVIKVNQ